MSNPIPTCRVLSILTLALPLFPCGCVTPPDSKDADYAFRVKHVDFRYSKVREVRQTSQRSCGAAALTSLIRYWREDAQITEPELQRKYPSKSSTGYSILQLREVAVEEQLLAFAVTMDKDPMKQLSSHLRKGRPVLVAVELPYGRYFVQNVPVIETLDRRTVQLHGVKKTSKAHYLVVMGDSADEMLVMDPQYGYVQVKKTDFEKFWADAGYAALITSALPQGVKVNP